jgi:hypothetical protein
MWALLEAIEALEEKRGEGLAFTPNEIAVTMGLDGPRRHGRFNNGKGNWTGHMAPAQRIISTLKAVDSRGLVSYSTRRDGRSGSAYALSRAGREALDKRRRGEWDEATATI